MILILVVAFGTRGKDADEAAVTPKVSTPGSAAAPSMQPEQEKAPETISVSQELDSGHYTSGIDFPAGKYDIEAVSGGGNVSSSNAFSGGINAVMGTKDKNTALGTDLYEQKYSNISLDEGVVLSVSAVKVKITCSAASGKPLTARKQSITKTVTLENGNFIAGEDFDAGVYDLSVVSGGGNVSSDNAMNGGLNVIMGTADQNKAAGTDMYLQTFKNAVLDKGVTLTLDGVKIQLVPSK